MVMDKKIKERNTLNPYLHEDLIFNILVRLPADVLHKSMRLVCKGWANIIRHPLFIEAHLLRANTGIFVESIDSPGCARFFEIKDGEVRVTELKRQFPRRMVASCEGVSLFTDPIDHRALYVANPATLQVTKLPYLNLPPNPLFFSSSIARISPTGQYKVVHAYKDSRKVCHWLLLTVGVDNSWRKIDCHPAIGSGQIDLECFPVSVGGVVYWIDFEFYLDGDNYFLAMDMGDETIHKVPIPSGRTDPCTYLKMGSYLSSFTLILPSTLQFEVCVLKDMCRGEWAKVYVINIGTGGGIPRNLFCVFPIGWINSDQILILEALTSQGDVLLAYNVETQETKLVDFELCGCEFSQIHTNSLVSWITGSS
ncbi:hypothetical protein L1049_012308 [Liquidambar formosana]|uniref:F-box associated beta-propeller type 3 domain-containing protein n=1 Tax=Liquidambar formosana TaxID=63359 RepID=A0AAP0X396_LIQFO